MNTYYTIVTFMSIFAMLMMLFIVRNNDIWPKDKKRLFITVFELIIITTFSEWLGARLNGANTMLIPVHIIAKTVELSLAPFLAVLYAFIIGSHKRAKWFIPLIIVHAVLEIISAFTGFIFKVDSFNIYHHGDFYIIYIAAYTVTALYLFAEMLIAAKRYQYRNGYILAMLIAFLAFGICVPMMAKSVYVAWLCVSISGMILYVMYEEMVQQVDAVTLLLNRRCYEIALKRLNRRTAIVYFDVDNFKHINDTYGHPFGDKCLATVGEELQKVYAKNGKCYRIGGDEYCALVYKHLQSIEEMNSEITERLNKRRLSDARLPELSVGYVIYDPLCDDIEDTVKKADTMMYKNKQTKQ